MANLQASTVTRSTARVTDPDAVEAILEEYNWGNINWELRGDTNDELAFWGYTTFDPYQTDEDGHIAGEHLTTEVLYRLSQYIEDGERLEICDVGFMKCRSAHGVRWIVSPYRVEQASLDSEQMIVEPPVSLAEYFDDDALDALDMPGSNKPNQPA
jgi:hypothetical protein